MEEPLTWFAVRTLYQTGVADGMGIYGERIILYQARDAEAAAELADKDATKFLALNKEFMKMKQVAIFVVTPDREGFNGREIWSVLHQGSTDPDEFYQEKYAKFEIPPDDESDQTGDQSRLLDDEVDRLLLSQAKPTWRKVAMVIGLAQQADDSLDEKRLGRRIVALVEAGKLESQGDVRKWRYSEVRLPAAGR